MNPAAVIEIFRRNVIQHYFDMKGRVGREEFWYFILGCVAVLIVVAILDALIHTGLLAAVVGLGLLPPMAGLGARRLQDIGRNGALVWVLIVPSAIMQIIALLVVISGPYGVLGFLYFFVTIGWLINLIVLAAAILLIYFWAQPGVAGPNAFGPDPKAGGKK